MKSERAIAPGLCLDFGQGSLKLLAGDRGAEILLERSETGRLTPSSRERVLGELRAFLAMDRDGPDGHAGRRAPPLLSVPVRCAIPARGVSLRRITLPPAGREEAARLLELQLEREFPLPPAELAWGRLEVSPPADARRNGAPRGREFLVAALRAASLAEYEELLRAAGLEPRFRLGILAGSALAPAELSGGAILDLGRTHSELLDFQGGVPESLRILPWGGESLTRAIAEAAGISPEEAERRKLLWSETAEARGERGGGADGAAGGDPIVERAVADEVDRLARLLDRARPSSLPPRETSGGAPERRQIFLTGGAALLPRLPEELGRALGDRIECRRLPIGRRPGLSAVTLALAEQGGREERAEKKSSPRPGKRPGEPSEGREGPELVLAVSPEIALSGEALPPRSRRRRWMAAAILLGLLSVSLRYAGPFLRTPDLERRIAAARAARGALPRRDREIAFLEQIRSSRLPHLEILTALSDAAPAGTTVESVNLTRAGELTRTGELTLRASLPGFAALQTFREKLFESGWFASVVIEEQSPAKDKSRIDIRLGARWKTGPAPAALPPAAALPKADLGPKADPGTKAEAAAKVEPPRADAAPKVDAALKVDASPKADLPTKAEPSTQGDSSTKGEPPPPTAAGPIGESPKKEGPRS